MRRHFYSAILLVAISVICHLPCQSSELPKISQYEEKCKILNSDIGKEDSLLELALIGQMNLDPFSTGRLKSLQMVLHPGKESHVWLSQQDKEDLINSANLTQLQKASAALTRIEKGRAHISLKRYADAVRDFDLVLQEFPVEPTSLLYKADCLARLKRYEESVATFDHIEQNTATEKALKTRGSDLKQIAEAYYKLKKYKEAAKLYNWICSDYRGGVKFDGYEYVSKGNSLFTIGEYKSCVKCYRDSLNPPKRISLDSLLGSGSGYWVGPSDLEQRVSDLEYKVNSQ